MSDFFSRVRQQQKKQVENPPENKMIKERGEKIENKKASVNYDEDEPWCVESNPAIWEPIG